MEKRDDSTGEIHSGFLKRTTCGQHPVWRIEKKASERAEEEEKEGRNRAEADVRQENFPIIFISLYLWLNFLNLMIALSCSFSYGLLLTSPNALSLTSASIRIRRCSLRCV
jgi:hypothetical protein